MLIFWRGKGWLVPVILIGWVFVAVGFAIATAPDAGDPDAGAHVDLLFAVVFVVSAITVYLMDRRTRARILPIADAVPGEPHLAVYHDHFMFLPVKWYTWVFLAGAVFMAGKSFTE
jgi:hypothetical protein